MEIGKEVFLLHGLRLDGSSVLALFFVRVDAEVHLNAFALGCSFNEAADGRGGEALATDEGGDVRLTEDEAEIDFVLAGVADAEFRELWVFDELEGDVLDEVFDLSGDFFHGERFSREWWKVGEEASFEF